ncbi:restriction endonuclease subunit S [Clostridium oryzae]|uniref:EcoKI restriction-modification system protein HsdS n=1 Tax=Clostridium oryzae TaxID=1450648 RepID=A0A1V4IXX9_9CLOT|nr:restriction endonuclease subunit S [Clostridium oryzae]OPJ64806.1 EcoKI restriction-modification system protein HsdS [Clostridium oryzae]
MDKNKANVPKLRFPGFTDPWEQRKVCELIEDYIEKTEIQNQYPVLTSSQQKGIVFQEDYFADRQVTTNDNVGYFILPKGYFTYRSRSDTNLFVFNRNDIIHRGIISYYYPVFCVKDTDSNFFLRRINFGMNSQLAMAAEGTGQHVLSLSKFKNMITTVPSLPEQKQIGLLFEHLDHLITLHQRKLKHLQDKKKGLLQKMFPKDGEDFPEIRFPGFTDPWEQRKMGEMTCLITKGTTPIDKSGNGNINFVKIENIDSSSGEINISSKISEEEHNGYLKRSQLQENDILFSIAGTLGRVTSVNKGILPANTNQALAIIRLKTGCLEYVKTYLKGKAVSDFIKKNPTIGAQPNLSLEQVGNLNIDLPSFKEQQEIGTFFNELDHLITLHQRKLNHLQEQKKALLQQMFV